MLPVSWYLFNHHRDDDDHRDDTGEDDNDKDRSPVEDLRDAAMADPQLPADHTRSHPGRRHLDNLQPHVVWQRPPVDEHAAHLVDPALPLERVAGEEGGGHGGGLVGYPWWWVGSPGLRGRM